jgi:hypothetical protein
MLCFMRMPWRVNRIDTLDRFRFRYDTRADTHESQIPIPLRLIVCSCILGVMAVRVEPMPLLEPTPQRPGLDSMVSELKEQGVTTHHQPLMPQDRSRRRSLIIILLEGF